MKYYAWVITEGEDSGEQVPAEYTPDPEPSAGGEGDGSGESGQEEAAPGYTEDETETEETEEQTEEEEIEEDTNQYGLVEVDYSESLTAISDQLEEITILGYALTFVIAAGVVFTLVLKVLRS